MVMATDQGKQSTVTATAVAATPKVSLTTLQEIRRGRRIHNPERRIMRKVSLELGKLAAGMVASSNYEQLLAIERNRRARDFLRSCGQTLIVEFGDHVFVKELLEK